MTEKISQEALLDRLTKEHVQSRKELQIQIRAGKRDFPLTEMRGKNIKGHQWFDSYSEVKMPLAIPALFTLLKPLSFL